MPARLAPASFLALILLLPATTYGGESCEPVTQILPPADGGPYFASSVGILGTTLAISDHARADFTGAIHIYEYEVASWELKQTLIPEELEPGDGFGALVLLFDDAMFVSAATRGDEGDIGAVFTFSPSEGMWIKEQELVPSDGVPGDHFGLAMARLDNMLFVGSLSDEANVDAGAVYVFERQGSSWVEIDKIIPDDVEETANFGTDITLSGDMALIGAPFGDGGAVYIYQYDGASWQLEQKLSASDGADGARFGRVALSGGTLMIGATRADSEDGEVDVGAVYVFTHDGSSWVEIQKLVPSDGGYLDHFGWGIELVSDMAIISSQCRDWLSENTGSAYVFRRDESSWIEERIITAPTPNEGDRFGWSMSSWGDALAISAVFNDEAGENAGAAYVFTGILGDCNANGEADYCDVVGGESQDIDSNGIPDECESCDGDANGDGLVDPLDSGFVLARFGCPVGTGDSGCDTADMNGDGLVDPLDSGFVLARFGPCS